MKRSACEVAADAMRELAKALREMKALEIVERANDGDPFARHSLAEAGHPRWVEFYQTRRRMLRG